MQKSWLVIIIFQILLVFAMSGCAMQGQVKYDRDFFAMDTYIACQVLSADEERAAEALDAVQAAFMEIDWLTNRFAQDSEIAAINRNAGVAPVKVSTDVLPWQRLHSLGLTRVREHSIF